MTETTTTEATTHTEATTAEAIEATTEASATEATEAPTLACGRCGVAVPEPTEPPELITRPLPALGGQFGWKLPTRWSDGVAFATCADCAERTELATELVAGHPELRGLGNTTVAGLARALDQLAAAGVGLGRDAGDGRALLALMRRLWGTVAVWSARPEEQTRGTTWTEPFEFLTDEERAQLRESVSHVLARRVARMAPPVPVPAPNGGGCLFCGVGSVQLPAVAVVDLGGDAQAVAWCWRPLTTSTQALGGQPTSERLSGHLCRACHAARAEVGSTGQPAMVSAYAAHLKDTGQARKLNALSGWRADPHLVDGMRGWGALSPRPAPSTARWEHLGAGGGEDE